MLKNRGIRFRFLWFGKGELEEELRQEVRDKNLEDIIQFMGNRGDIYNVLQAADIFLFPSVWEGLGIACVEAQAAGLPTLCSDTIPVEAKATELCYFLPLNDTKVWCDELEKTIREINAPQYIRADTHQQIVNAEYDIANVTEWLQTYYLKRYRNAEFQIGSTQ